MVIFFTSSHSPLWEDVNQSNTAGKCIEKVILEVPVALVLTPFGLNTYYNIRNGSFSTIDLQIGPAYLLPHVTIRNVQHLQTDHSAILTTINDTSCETVPPTFRFNYKKADWQRFKRILSDTNYEAILQAPEVDQKPKF